MIVNPAYIYMGAGGGEPVNPNLWENGVTNYPAVFNGASISSNGILFNSSSNSVTFSELPLTGFKSLTLTGGTQFGSISKNFTVKFFNSTDDHLGSETVTFTSSAKTQTVSIPASARIKDAKIKITGGGNAFLMSSAVLS